MNKKTRRKEAAKKKAKKATLEETLAIAKSIESLKKSAPGYTPKIGNQHKQTKKPSKVTFTVDDDVDNADQ